MTVGEFVQAVVLVLCLMATGIVLPIGLVAGSASHEDGAAGPVFIFTETR
jgi:hypothetical protein